jgi:uncharacterized protein Yka (UPF0111/DUF47 family)
MNQQDLKQRIDRIEQCADEAKRAVMANSSVPSALRMAVDSFHQQASQAKHAQMDEGQMRQCVMQLEQLADRAMEACRSGGNQIDPQTQQAVQKAHGEASKLKKEVEAGSPA